MRKILAENQIHPQAAQSIAGFHLEVISEIEIVLKNNEWVIVGMKQNPVVSSARKYLTNKNISFQYVEHGSYFSMWKQRLAIKLWSGWPTFPQVFHNGKLIGGFSELKKYKV